MIHYKHFRDINLSTYQKFSPYYAKTIQKLCSSSIFPSSILITGEIGVGKSKFTEILTQEYHKNTGPNISILVIYVDTPVVNSAQCCREVLQKSLRLIQIYHTRVFIIFDEAHILSFIAQQVFLSSLEKEYNLTICFVTHEMSKICEAIQNRSLVINIEKFNNNDNINEFAKYVLENTNIQDKTDITTNYEKFLSMNIHSSSSRDIINSILYGDFSKYENIGDVNSIQHIINYIDKKILKGESISITNILNIISDYLFTLQCTCNRNTKICKICEKINTYIKLHNYINNYKSMKLLLKLLNN
jgi:replication-associated recombination protein RarA